jgi:hypothetical protein
MATNNRELRKRVEELAQELGTTYAEAAQIINNAVSNAIDGQTVTAAQRAAALAVVAEVTDRLAVINEGFIGTAIPETYRIGLQEANERLGNLADVKLTAGHAEVVNNLMDNARADFTNALVGVNRQANQVLNRATQVSVRNRIAEGAAKGQTILDTADNVIDAFKRNGVAVYVDRSGRQWSLDAYAKMLVRTETVTAANEASLNRGAQLGITIYQGSSHPGGTEDELCAAIDGKLFDTTGEKYPTPPPVPAHPNCRHILLPRPDLQ